MIGLVAPRVRAAPPPQPLQFGLWFSLGGNQNAQLKAIITDTLQLFAQRLKRPVTPVVFKNPQAFKQAVAAHPPPFLFATSNDLYKGYDPLVSMTLYHLPHTRLCLYVEKNSPFQKPADLKNKTIIINPDGSSYFSLRRLLGQKPENFLSELKATQELFGVFLAISLNQAHAGYASEVEYFHLKATNPGAVKKLRQVACGAEHFPFPPVFVRHDVPPALKKEAKDFFLSLHDPKNGGRLAPLFKLTGLQFRPFDAAAYHTKSQLEKEATTSGWQPDFARWKSQAIRRFAQ